VGSRGSDHARAAPQSRESGRSRGGVHHVAGEDCYLVKIRAKDAEHLGTLLRTRIGRIPGVKSTRTTIVLETVKETSRLLVPQPQVVRA